MKTNYIHAARNQIFILLLISCITDEMYGQPAAPADTCNGAIISEQSVQKTWSFKMTTLTFGGNGISLTKVNDQFTVMTGGRGSATFNGRYTIGGGGWGMTKGVEVESTTEGTYDFIKMGYGGVDFGYLIIPGNKFNLGTRLMVAGGALFKESVPDSKDKNLRMFPVLEPAVYYQISLSRLFRFEMGANYRFIWGTNRPYITDREMSGFSCYLGFLVSACNCY